MKKFHKYLFASFLSLSVIIVVLFYSLPWKVWLEEKIKSELTARDIAGVEFKIDSIGFNEINLKNVLYGEFGFPELSLVYNPIELLSGDFRVFRADIIVINKNNIKITLGDVVADFVLGKWTIGEINIDGASVLIPRLIGSGTLLKSDDNEILLAGDIYNLDKKINVSFVFNYSISDNKSATLEIININFPWNYGELTAKNIYIQLYSNKPVAINLNVKQVSLHELLVATLNNRISATGTVSGIVPIVIFRDGKFVIKKGNLKAEKSGTLMLSPDIIPSDVPDVVMLRDVFKDFRYSLFSMEIDTSDDRKLSMLLSLEGNNPKAYNGRSVKLNLNLTGNVMELVELFIN